MAKINGGTLIGKTLKNEGVKVAFTLCGGLSGIYDSCVDEGIELIDMRHEQAAANAATGYAMATRRPGVAMVTEGPGVINMAPGIATAWHASAPVIGMCTHTASCFDGMGAVQEFDSADLYRSITKWRGYCTSTSRVPEFVATAFRHAMSARKGPVLLDFPDDTLMLEVDEGQAPIHAPYSYRTEARPYGDPALIRQAAQLLLKAEKPGILIASGILWAEASEELMRFAEIVNVPVCYAIGGKSGIPDDHPLCGGPVGYNWGTIAGADVLLALGVKFEEVLNYGKGDFFSPDVKLISVNIDPAEIGRNRPITLGIWGDARAVLTQLADAAGRILGGKKRPDTDWVRYARDTARSIRDTLYAEASSDMKPIDPRRLGREVCEFADEDTYMVMDGGDIQAHVTPMFRATFPGSFVSATGGSLGHLGGGIPFGIGIKTARPDKKVIVIEGDGSFLLNASEIDTAMRHHKQIIVIVSNDCQWGMVRHDQQLNKHKDVCSKLSEDVRYDRYAESMGAYGEFVTDPGEIKGALRRAYDSGLPAVLDVRTDPSVLSFADYRGVELRSYLLQLHKQ
ncbi:MAG: thiamine pyrophosphate-binding protein [Dehalococcoidia bacterium]|nr:thiamine pyrophosphate-binding protein [Dehalococcoidia bacterium]